MMAYIKNADLTIKHVKRLVELVGYEDITSTAGKGCVLVVKTPENEIVGFRDLPHARRVLTGDIKQQRQARLQHWQQMFPATYEEAQKRASERRIGHA